MTLHRSLQSSRCLRSCWCEMTGKWRTRTDGLRQLWSAQVFTKDFHSTLSHVLSDSHNRQTDVCFVRLVATVFLSIKWVVISHLNGRVHLMLLSWAAVNSCLKISRKHHDFMESYGYNLWRSDNFMTSEAGWDESSVCRIICYPGSHTHWQWYSALLLAAITAMKFKVWIQTAFVFSFQKIRCFVLSSIDPSPASRKCLLRPGRELISVEWRNSAYISDTRRLSLDNMRW